MAEVMKSSSFSRTVINEAKMGAYYTDVEHCRRIGNLFSFPEENVCVLEPSIGDGSAVVAVTNNCPQKRIYGVELNRDTYEKIREDERFYVLNEDFLNGVKISNKVFSFCFSNPPYGDEPEKHERLEKLFADKIYNYIDSEGILVYVIPHSVLLEPKFVKPFFARFVPLSVYRFDDAEFEKYHQVCIVARKRHQMGYMTPWLDAFLQTVQTLEDIPYLPEAVKEEDKIKVLPSSDEKIVYFTKLVFDEKEAARKLKGSSLYSVIADKGFLKPYSATELGHPAVPLKKDLLYLCAIAGGGQGLTGSEENHDLHLQRGVAKVITSKDVVTDANGFESLVETSSTKIALNIIQNDGTVTTLE